VHNSSPVVTLYALVDTNMELHSDLAVCYLSLRSIIDSDLYVFGNINNMEPQRLRRSPIVSMSVVPHPMPDAQTLAVYENGCINPLLLTSSIPLFTYIRSYKNDLLVRQLDLGSMLNNIRTNMSE
jgi:hypothetical protein